MKTSSLSLRLLLVLLVLGSVHGHTARAADNPPARDAIVGDWQWNDGATVTMKEDGSFTGKTAKGNISGKWKLMDAAKKQYKLLWRINEEVAGMDTVALAADGQTLGGESADGKAVGGKRATANVTSPGDNTRPPGQQNPATTAGPSTNSGTTTTTGTRGGSSGAAGLPWPSFDFKLGTTDGKITIASTEANPLADMMKVKVGDRVVSINGQKTDGMNLENAQKLMRGTDGKAVNLEILRLADNSKVSVSMPGSSGSTAGRTTTTTTTTSVAPIPNDAHDIRIIGETEFIDDAVDPEEDPAEAKRRAANRKQAQTIIMRGAEYAEAGQWARAEAEYRKGVQLDPTRDDAWSGIGEACMAQKKWDDAVTAYRKVIDIWPDLGHSHADLALALLRQGKRDEALKEAREARRLGEEEHAVLKELGIK